MSNDSYEVEIVSRLRWDESHPRGIWKSQTSLDEIREGRHPMVCVSSKSIMWECPGCGRKYAARVGEEAISGWENPQWVVTESDGRLSANPSLGCSAWNRGECDGHWWLKDNRLVKA